MKTLSKKIALYTLKDFVSRKVSREYTKLLVGEEKSADMNDNTNAKINNYENAKDFLFKEMVTNIEFKDKKMQEIYAGKTISELIDEIPAEEFDSVIEEINKYKEEVVPKA